MKKGRFNRRKCLEGASRFERSIFSLAAAVFTCALALAEVRAAVPADFAKNFTVTVPAGLVDETLPSFPLLLRLGTGIDGFDYADFQQQNGADILVTDKNGSALPYELENWDTNGESRLWVRVPSVAEGTTLTVYYGSAETVAPPEGMWSGYAGVWHFNEAGDGATTIADSTVNAQNGTSHASSKACSGVLGAARGLELDAKNGAMTTVTSSDILDALVPTFTVSGWVRPSTLAMSWGYLFARKTSDADPSWGLQFRAADNANSVGIYSNGNADDDSNRAMFTTSGKFTANTWTKYHVVYDNTTIHLYLDGALVDSKSAKPGAAVSKSNDFGIGGFPTSDNHSSLKADQDEVRLMNGAVSAAWVAAEYRQESGAVALSYGEVQNTDATAPVVAVPALSRDPATGAFTISAELSNNVPVSVICDADGITNAMTTADSSLPMTYSATLAGLAANTTYACLVAATSTGGTVTESACPTSFYNGDISVVKVSDADETGLVPGSFRISRADSAYDLAVAYTVGGTAVSGRNYAALSGTATIPAGSTSVDIEIVPLYDTQTDADTTVEISLAAGLYGIDANKSSAVMTIVNHHFAEPADFAKKMTLTPSATVLETIGESIFENFPVLVRLPAEASAELMSADGTDLFFTDENDASLSFEVDTFNPAGETLVWVKVQSFSSATVLTAYFGCMEDINNSPSAVWTNYAGVWHMNEASGTIADATGNGLGASPAKKSAVSVAHAAGAVGTARQTATSDVKDYLTIPNYNSLGVGGNFTFSCFYDATARKGYDRLVSRKETHDAGNGWEVEMANASNKLSARGASATSIPGTFSDLVSSGWMRFTFVYSGTTLSAYLNGAQIGTGTITAATDNGKPLSIGCDSDGSEAYFVGYVDEARLRKGAASPAEVALEYATMADEKFFDQGTIEIVDATEQVFETPSVVRNANGTYTVTVVLRENNGDVGVIYDAGDTAITNIIATASNPGTYTDTFANIAQNTTYKFSAYGKNENGTEVVKKGGVFYNGDISIEKISDANENGLITGVFRISRADTSHDLTVAYTVGGTAAAGQTYAALSGTATIPAGATSVDVEVVPLLDAATTEDKMVVLTLNAGLYGIAEQAGSAEMLVVNLPVPEGFNVWVATEDGLASVGSNWSAGVAPTSSDNVLFDGNFSTANCEWDAAASATIASWTQTADYTGTVQINTTYDNTFPALNVSGDVEILGGNWTHKINGANDGQKYHLKAIVGGDFTLAVGCKLDAEMKGYWAQKYPAGSAVSAHAASYDGFDKIYGNVYRPADLGAGSSSSGSDSDNKSGGGAVWLEIGGAATLNGTINVRGRQFDGSNTACGSVYVKAKSCAGSGSILANFSAGSYYNGNRGAGGRVAIELTEATTLAFPTANVKINGINAGGSGGGGGTFYVKTADPAKPYGTLYLDDQRGKSYGARWHNPQAITAIPAGETWTFDAIVIRNYGMLAIPAGTTLNLPNGPMSVSASSTRQGGIRYDGGTINWGSAPYEFSGGWIFQANAPFTFNGDVTVKSGGAIGCLQYRGNKEMTNFTKCDITVNGNLTVESGGYLYANGGGPDMEINRDTVSFHGGQSAGASGNKAYDSIFNPLLPGYGTASGDQATSAPGGGLLLFNVTGAFVNNGSVTANGSSASNAGASGGSISITAGTLSGVGTFKADSASGSSGSAGGGRIAVRLTNGDFAAGAETNFFARGATVVKDNASSGKSSSAGTVYLQGKSNAEKGGTIYVRNDKNALNTNTYTPIPAGVTKGDVAPDAVADFKMAALVVGDCGRVKFFDELRLRSVEVELGSELDLNGKTLIVNSAKVGSVKLAPGTYAVDDDALEGFITDSATGGALVVKGGGFMLHVR